MVEQTNIPTTRAYAQPWPADVVPSIPYLNLLSRPKVVAGKEQRKEMRVCLFSLRNIKAGEELFYSYPPPHTVGLGEAIAPACGCRAPECRGRMSKREDQLF